MANGHGGKRKGAGAKKGSKHKSTELVEDILSTYKKKGGVNYLMEFSEQHPKEFMKLLEKLIPRNIDTTIDTGETLTEIIRKVIK